MSCYRFNSLVHYDYKVVSSFVTDDEVEKYRKRYADEDIARVLERFNLLKFPLVVYRALCTDTGGVNDVNVHKLGTSWTTRLGSAGCYDSSVRDKNKPVTIVKAKINSSDVNWSATFAANLDETFGDNEQEIKLVPGTHLKVLEISSPLKKDPRFLDIHEPEQVSWVKVNRTGTV